MCEKTKALISKILSRQNCSVTMIMKLCYFIDLVAVRENGNKISDFSYIRYRYGPYDEKIYSILRDLENSKNISSHEEYTFSGAGTIVYKNEELISFNFTENENSVIDKVLDDLSGYGAKALTDLAYATGPMKKLGATLGGDENLGKELVLE